LKILVKYRINFLEDAKLNNQKKGKLMKNVISAFVLIFMTSCALAPMTSVKTARPLGKGNWQVNAGLEGTYSLLGGYGVSENFDMGLLLETGLSSNYGIWSKYSFKSKEQDGGSFSLYGGASAFSGFSSGHSFFVGPIFSYKWEKFEYFFITRFNYVAWNTRDINLKNEDDNLFDDIDYLKGSFSYLQADTGLNLWLKPVFAINVTAKFFYSFEAEKTYGTFGFNVLFRFNKN